MNRSVLIPFLTGLLLSLAALSSLSCVKDVPDAGDGEIVLDFGAVPTRVSAFTALSGSTLYWAVTTGALGNETSYQTSLTFTPSSENPTVHTGIYQTRIPTTYNYYVSNVFLDGIASEPDDSFTGPVTVIATGGNGSAGKDVVVGRTTTDNTTVQVSLEHVFARVVSLHLGVSSGYTLSGVSWSIRRTASSQGTAGIYNLSTGTWSGTSGLSDWTAFQNAAVMTDSGRTATTSDDLYVIPGDYYLKVTYTCSRGDWSVTRTVTKTVTLQKGRTNDIVATVTPSPGANEVVISVSPAAWDNELNPYNVSESS